MIIKWIRKQFDRLIDWILPLNNGVIRGNDADIIWHEIQHDTPDTPVRIRRITEADRMRDRDDFLATRKISTRGTRKGILELRKMKLANDFCTHALTDFVNRPCPMCVERAEQIINARIETLNSEN